VWEILRRSDLTLLPLPEAIGGGGGSVEDTVIVLRKAGWFSAPVPLVETALLAGWMLAGAGLDVPTGPLTAAVPADISLERVDGGWNLTGRIGRLPWARDAERVVLLTPRGERPLVLSVDLATTAIVLGVNVADEARDDVVLNATFVPDGDAGRPHSDIGSRRFMVRGALGRAALMAGAAGRALDLSIRYAGQRTQFGRPIAEFQAVQQHLAVMASQVAALDVAVERAAVAVDAQEPSAELLVAAAKVQAGLSGSAVARLAHQVHGAIGFTHEHALHHSTTRLWAWREEFGSETHWADVLGIAAHVAGPDGLWPLVAL
jgi:acyl-CoA dehydrogenase